MYFDYREDTELSPDLQLLKENAHRFALANIRPASVAIDRLGDPQDAIRKNTPLWGVLRESYRRHYHAAALPREVNGQGLSGLGLEALFEEIGWGDAGLAFTLLASALPFLAAILSAKPDLVGELTRPFADDTEAALVGCWAFAEPESGSVQTVPANHRGLPLGMRTSVTPAGNAYIVRGLKAIWVANAPIATHALTHVRLDDPGPQGALIVVPLNSIRISRSHPTDKSGQRALSQGDLMFHEASVPARYLLAAGDAAERMRAELFSLCHALTSAIMTGVARAALEETLIFSQTRVSGEKPISDHQLVRNRLFELFTEVEACRTFSRSALRRYGEGSLVNREYSMAAKIFCSQAAYTVTSQASHIFGVAGLARNSLMDKLFRDARMSLIEYGPNDVLSVHGAGLLLDGAT